MHLDLTYMRLESAPFRLRQYISVNLKDWIDKTVVDSIQAYARAAGVSQNYLDSIHVTQTGDLSAEVTLEYIGPKGEPLGLWFERGTKAHIIRAIFARFLHWKSTGPAAAYFPQFSKVKGDLTRDHFAKQVKHPGTKAHHIMEIGAKDGIPRLKEMIIMEVNNFLQETKMQ